MKEVDTRRRRGFGQYTEVKALSNMAEENMSYISSQRYSPDKRDLNIFCRKQLKGMGVRRLGT